jgi:hypothetical protein
MARITSHLQGQQSTVHDTPNAEHVGPVAIADAVAGHDRCGCTRLSGRTHDLRRDASQEGWVEATQPNRRPPIDWLRTTHRVTAELGSTTRQRRPPQRHRPARTTTSAATCTPWRRGGWRRTSARFVTVPSGGPADNATPSVRRRRCQASRAHRGSAVRPNQFRVVIPRYRVSGRHSTGSHEQLDSARRTSPRVEPCQPARIRTYFAMIQPDTQGPAYGVGFGPASLT